MEEFQAEQYLLQIPMWTKQKNSPGNIRVFLRELGNPQDKLSLIHVAGTNGKGSVCAFLSSILRAAGRRAGMFVSPHLVDVRERIVLDGQTAGRKLFEECFRQVLSLTRRLEKEGLCHPSFFEFLFYMALLAFQKSGMEYAILETGLGGRLDVTNVIERPKVCVITSISFDHMEYLGDTIPLIAGEKAGIIKPGCPLVYSAVNEEARPVIEKKALEAGAVVCPVTDGDYEILEDGGECPLILFTSRDGERRSARLPFTAPYQAENLLLAVRAIEHLGEAVPWESMKRGIEAARWPGRMEEVLPGVYLDGAHNPGGIAAFIQAAARLRRRWETPMVLLFAVSADKEYREMIHMLTKDLKPDFIVTAHMQNPRGMDRKALLGVFREEAQCPVEGKETVEEALELAMRRKGENGLLVCAGSLYLIGEIKEKLRRYGHD